HSSTVRHFLGGGGGGTASTQHSIVDFGPQGSPSGKLKPADVPPQILTASSLSASGSLQTSGGIGISLHVCGGGGAAQHVYFTPWTFEPPQLGPKSTETIDRPGTPHFSATSCLSWPASWQPSIACVKQEFGSPPPPLPGSPPFPGSHEPGSPPLPG